MLICTISSKGSLLYMLLSFYMQSFVEQWYTLWVKKGLSKVGIWSNFRQDIIDTVIDHENGGNFEHLLWTNLQTICIFHVFLVHVASVHCVRFLLCWCLIVDRPTLLNCKALNLLRTVNEQKSKMLIFCRVLIFALIFMTFDRYLLARW